MALSQGACPRELFPALPFRWILVGFKQRKVSVNLMYESKKKKKTTPKSKNKKQIIGLFQGSSYRTASVTSRQSTKETQPSGEFKSVA